MKGIEYKLFPAKVFSYNETPEGAWKDYELYNMYKCGPIGTQIVSSVAAPGCGYIIQEITRITPKAIYGRLVSSTARELTINEVI